MKTIANIKVGKADVNPTLPSHVQGVNEGNARGGVEHESGMSRRGGSLKVTARRSTGITPEDSNPIDPKSPVLPPA